MLSKSAIAGPCSPALVPHLSFGAQPVFHVTEIRHENRYCSVDACGMPKNCLPANPQVQLVRSMRSQRWLWELAEGPVLGSRAWVTVRVARVPAGSALIRHIPATGHIAAHPGFVVGPAVSRGLTGVPVPPSGIGGRSRPKGVRVSSPAGMTMTTRRFLRRPSGVSLSAMGRYSP